MNRLYGLDLLRALLIIEGVFYHAGLIVSPNKWTYSSDIYNSYFYGVVFQFFHIFRMETFFILSGFFSALVIINKNLSYFTEMRIKRLFFPFIILVFFIGLPQQIYLLTINEIDTTEISYASFLSHLWFLETLILITLLHFILVRKNIKIDKFVIIIFSLIYFLATPLSGILNKTIIYGISSSVKNFLSFSFFYFFGVYFYHNKDCFLKLIKDKILYIIFITIISTIVLIINFYQNSLLIKLDVFLSSLSFTYKYIYLCIEIPLLKLISSLGISLILIYFFSKLQIKNSLIEIIVEAALPIYVLHHPFVIFFGYHLDNIGLSINTYFLLVSTLSLIIPILIYLFFRQSVLFRFIFGLKNKKII